MFLTTKLAANLYNTKCAIMLLPKNVALFVINLSNIELQQHEVHIFNFHLPFIIIMPLLL